MSVVREKVDRGALASTFVGSPDPLQENPPHGQKLYIRWRLPYLTDMKNKYLSLSIIFQNYQTQTLLYPLDHHRGVIVYSLLNEDYFSVGGLLTYKAEIMDGNHKVIKKWQHSLWVDLITIEE